MESKGRILSKIIFAVIFLIAIIIFVNTYRKYNYNDYTKVELQRRNSDFLRDTKVKYSKMDSYKIINKNYNDAMFYKEIPVEPNTPYKISCMVKTEKVETKQEVSTAGAFISQVGTVQKSRAITGTTDWQKIELLVDSKKETSLKIGFRLGGNEDECKGKVWFSDFRIEAGTRDVQNNTWKFALFIMDEIQVQNPNGKQGLYQITMKQEEKDLIKQNFQRFGNSIRSMSNQQIEPELTVYEIKEPITHISYDEKNGYHVDPKDVENLIDSYVKAEEWDHLFIAVKLGDIETNQTELVKDWIGLGAMEYYGIGYSNIRLPNDTNSNIYRYNAFSNSFPEEVLVHEFLHSLERNLVDRGYNIPALHDNEKYGYENQKVIGLQKWYSDYMKKEITDGNGNKVGLEPEVYHLQPAKESNFNYSYAINSLQEPKNVIEVVKAFFKKVNFIFQNKKEGANESIRI